MNTLKPLLTVAVLAGIGYGVYIRLNAGANAPPPPVDAGWNSTPNIQLPGETSSAPWAVGGGSVAAPPSSSARGPGPVFQSPANSGVGGEAPQFESAPPATTAPPFGAGPPPPATDPAVAAAVAPAVPITNPYDTSSYESPAQDAKMPDVPFGASTAEPYSDAPYPPSSGIDPNGATPTQSDPGSSYPADDYPTPPAAGSPLDARAVPSGDFAAAMGAAQRELENGQLASALRELTPWHGNPQLAPQEQQQLSTLLDQVAGTVVYSTQNVLEHPYEVQPGERLETIGEKYQVPWQLLAKINGIEDPNSLQPGERLKVIRGPFEAVVHLERRELVLRTAEGLYAGRFKIGVGGEHPPQEGIFAVSDKSENPVYYGRERTIAAEDPNNPLGERWIGLGQQMAIHGTNNPENIGRNDLPGWISLSEPDVADVYDILSLGSRVTIQR